MNDENLPNNNENKDEIDIIKIDSEVKKDPKYKDDYETFLNKLKQNGFQPNNEANHNSNNDLSNNNNNNNYNNHDDNANGNGVKSQDILDLNKEDYLSDQKPGKNLNENETENWDQFESNKEKFNLETNYDEVLYTTKLEKDKLTEEEKERAERIEREILNDKTKDNHILEERGQNGTDNIEEEFKYSSVYRNSIANNIIQEHGQIFGIKKSLFYFLLFLLLAFLIALVNLKMNANHQVNDGEEYEEDEKMPEAVVLNSEPIENENL